MHRNDGPGNRNGHFRPPDPATGLPGTVPDYQWYEAIQEELIAPLTAAGITPVKGSNAQLLQAIRRLLQAEPGGGDVFGPEGATAGHLPAFSGTTGKILADSGLALDDVARAPWTRRRMTLQAVPFAGVLRASGWDLAPSVAGRMRTETRPEGLFAVFPTTGASSGEEVAGIETPHYRYFQPQWRPVLAGTFRTPTNLTGIRIWLGAVSGYIATRTTPSGRAVAALRFVDGVDSGWTTVTCDGSANVEVHAGQTRWGFQPDTVYAWRIEFDASGDVHFWIDGEPAAEVHDAFRPAAGVWLGATGRLAAAPFTARDFGISLFAVEHR